MPEPTMTLGLLFRRHVARWVMDTVPTPPPGELEALCARADAAEQLAEATVFRDEAMADESETRRPGYRSDIPNVVFTVRLLAAKEAYSEAIAAWRAITEEVQP